MSTNVHTFGARRGFTIVELLIVIVVIGILAAITIVAYNGIQSLARVAVLQSDLSGASKVLGAADVVSGTFPPTLAGAGLKASEGTAYQYTYAPTDNSYCLTATNNKVTYIITSSNNIPTAGICPGHTPPSGGSSVNGGVVATLAGSTQGFNNGTGAAAQFSNPNAMAVDSAGNIYVADFSNNRIRAITSGGVVTTLAGSGVAGFANGTVTAAQFNDPFGVAVDSAGKVYVADSTIHLIRTIQ